jgi:hypothetical protein
MPARLIGAALIALALAGCAKSPPVPLYSPQAAARYFGYSEQPVAQNTVRVTYVTPAVRLSSPSYVESVRAERTTVGYDLALWRAAELALAAGYPAFSVTDRQNDVDVNNYTYYSDNWDPWGCPYYYRGCFGRPGYWPPERWIDVSARVSFIARFEPTNTPNNYNAQFVIDQAKARYGAQMVKGYYASAPSTSVSASIFASK